MGADIETTDGRPPVVIRGGQRLHGIDYALPVASAQVKSAVLLAGLYAEATHDAPSPRRPAITPSACWRALARTLLRNGSRVSLRGRQTLQRNADRVPGDISSAAFFLVAGLHRRGQGLLLRNVGINPTRTGLLDILRAMGGDIRITPLEAAGPEPVADIEVRPSALRGHRGARSAGAAGDR